MLLSGWTAVFLWWFCLSVFDWTFKPRGIVLYVGLAWMLVACVDRGVFGEAQAGRGLSWLLIAMGLGMIAHLAWRLYRDCSSDLIDHRRRARAWVVALLAGQLLADMVVDLVLGLEWRSQGFSIAQNLAVLSFAGWLLTLEGDRDDRPSQPVLSRSTALTVSAVNYPSALALRVRRLVEVDRIHLDPGLDFANFVGMVGASERVVRQLIRQHYGYDHFRTFLNANRMAEARRLLSDPDRHSDKLIVIAMDSGFASIPSFNRTFQLFENTSPGAFRRAALNQKSDQDGEPREDAGI